MNARFPPTPLAILAKYGINAGKLLLAALPPTVVAAMSGTVTLAQGSRLAVQMCKIASLSVEDLPNEVLTLGT